MSILKKGRFFYWLVSGLIRKYYKQIIIGLFVGVILVTISKDALIALERILSRNTLIIGVVGDYSVSTLPNDILSKISYGLTTLDESGNVLPGLASSWEATKSGENNYLYTFTLKDNLVWQDGKKITASDINYNIKSVTYETKGNTIVFHLPTSYSPFLTVVSKPIFSKGLIGAGEYKVTGTHIQGGSFQSLTITPKNLDKPTIQYKFYKTEPQAQIALKLGEINELHGILTLDTSLQTWKNITISEKTNYGRMVTLFFNMKDPLMAEKSFRQALAYSIPKLPGERAYSPVSKNSWAYTDAVKKYTFDEKQAKKLFDQTKSGTSSSELTLHTFPQYMDLAKIIADSWTAFGIHTTIKVESTVPSDYQVLLTARDIPLDPDQYAFWHSLQIDSRSNISAYANVKNDQLLENGRAAMDLEERKKLYIDFQKRLVEDAPAVFLLYPKTYSIVRK